MARPGPFLTLEPSGTRLMTSTPQATATSTAPAPTSEAARLVACCDDPHWLSTVVAATERGSPAVSQAVRATLNDCSPTWVTHPPTTWPTRAGSTPVRSTSAARTVASRSAGWQVDSPPPRRPMGVRTASTTTTSLPAEGTAGPGQAPAAPLDRAPVELPRSLGLEEVELVVHVLSMNRGCDSHLPGG